MASFFDLIAACEEHSTESQTRSRSAVELLHIIDSKKRSHLSWKGRQTIQSKRVASSFDLIAACVERSTEAEHVENAWEVCLKSTLCKLFIPLCCYRISNQGPGSWSRKWKSIRLATHIYHSLIVWLYTYLTMTPSHRLDEALRWIGFNSLIQREEATTSLRGC